MDTEKTILRGALKGLQIAVREVEPAIDWDLLSDDSRDTWEMAIREATEILEDSPDCRDGACRL